MKLPSMIMATLGFSAMAFYANAATLVTYDFENYAAGSRGNDGTIVDDLSTNDRVYDRNITTTPNPTGFTSVTPISMTVANAVSGQNKVEFNNSSNRFRWRLTNSPVTASFSVTIDSGYQLENFALSMVQFSNNSGTIVVTYNGIEMTPTGSIDSDDTLDAGSVYSTNTVGTAVTGTVNFLVTVTPNSANRTSRWDDIVLSGDLVAVPEPSPVIMLGLGACMLLARRRR